MGFTGSVWATPFTLGSDPEAFLEMDGKIIGAEKVIPKEGLTSPDPPQYHIYPRMAGPEKVVRDGVQIELHPAARTCRALAGNDLANIFRTLHRHLVTNHPRVKVSFTPVVEVEPEELASLDPASRELGCQPSLNVYGDFPIRVGDNFFTRSAGGHIHISRPDPYNGSPEPSYAGMWKKDVDIQSLVKILDAFVGNTCVLIDRDARAADRRKTYGRAGEFRLPGYGVEYRTLSNFWLRSYPLMGFVYGITRLASSLVLPEWSHVGKAFLDSSDIEKVREAINTNDLKLAKENWDITREFIKCNIPPQDTGLDQSKLPLFDHFLKMVEEKGLAYWFPEDPITHWRNIGHDLASNPHYIGWETFLNTKVSADRQGITTNQTAEEALRGAA